MQGLPPFIREPLKAFVRPLEIANATGESEVVRLDVKLSVGQFDQSYTSISAHHFSDASKAADFRSGAKLADSDGAIAFSFAVNESVDSFQLGELSGFVKNLLGLALGASNNSAIKVSGKVDTTSAGERLYRLILSFPDGSELGQLINSLQLGEGYMGEVSLSHRFGDAGQQGVPVKAKVVVQTDITRAYLQGVMQDMRIPIAPLALALNNFTFGFAFDDLEAMKKALPGMIDQIDVSSLGVATTELNQMLAAALKNEDTPAPLKETFYSFRENLKSLHDISLYVGDHTLSLNFEGFEFDKVFLSKEQLAALEVPEGGGVAGGIFAQFNMRPPWVKKDEARVLLLGLDAGGKTTVLYKLKLGEVVTTIPTIGFNVENVEYKNILITLWDVGGQPNIRPLWRHYLANTHAIIYVVDSNDRERLSEAGEELRKMLAEQDLANAAVLVFANKQDLPSAISVSEIADTMQLNNLGAGRSWYIQASCAITGDGLYEGLDWLSVWLKDNIHKK